MAAAHGDPDELVIAQVAGRWQALDSLLPVPTIPAAADGERFTACLPDAPTAVGGCGHWAGTPGTLEMCWGAARRFELTARVGGQDVTEALDQLLTAWHDHVAVQPGAGEEDTAAVVSWPSRDVEGVIALLRHGLQPLAVVAVRSGPPGSRLTNEPANAVPELPLGLQIRRAGPADLDAVVRLEDPGRPLRCAFRRGGRPALDRGRAADRSQDRAGCGRALGLAGRAGRAGGRRAARPAPSDAGWHRPADPARPGGLRAAHRGQRGRARGGGGRRADRPLPHRGASGRVAVNLPHYTQVNPRSVPFWSQQGYRPLWTIWEAHPASSLR